jgi:hypothetical protein
VEDLVGKVAAKRFLHEVFAAAALEAQARGQASGELHQAVVEQRFARFKADSHRGAVDLGEDVAR